MHFFEVLEIIRKRPGMYVGSPNSLRSLMSLVNGYALGRAECKLPLTGADDMDEFEKWVEKRYAYTGTMGVCNLLIEQSGADEKAFDLYFELFDLYRSQSKP